MDDYSKIILEILARTPESVLDVGGARGEVVKILEEKGVNATCVDISKICWDNRVTDKFSLCDILEMPWPFKDKEFDLCTGFGVLKYIPAEKLDLVLHEMARVTRRGFFGVGLGIRIPPLNNIETKLEKPADWWSAQFTEIIPNYPVEVLPMSHFKKEGEI